MNTQNEALVVIEEGTDIEVHTESLLCCFSSFIFLR